MDAPLSPGFRTFALEEVCHLIAEEILHSGNEGKATLLDLVLTCRTVHSNALPVLWQRLTSLEPLLRLLPENTWVKERPGRYQPVTFNITARADRLDWTRVRERARYVREFCWESRLDVGVPTLHRLCTMVSDGERPLLPYLRVVKIEERRREYIQEVRFLLASEHIHDLCIKVEYRQLPLSLVDALSSCRAVKHLDLDYQDDPAANTALAKWLGNLRKLQSFAVFTLSISRPPSRPGDVHTKPGFQPWAYDLAIALAQLPDLRIISIQLRQQDIIRLSHHYSASRPKRWFPALEKLRLFMSTVVPPGNDPYDGLAEFLQSLQTTALRSLTIKMPNADTSEAYVQRMLATLSSAPWAPALTEFKLSHLSGLVPVQLSEITGGR